MTIARIEAFPVRYPEPNNDGKIRALTLVRIEADDGRTGWGEAITGGQETSLAVAFVVERRLAPLLIGQDPTDVVGLWRRMRDATYWDGNGGLVTFGISALDMALFRPRDVAISDVPRLLGRSVVVTTYFVFVIIGAQNGSPVVVQTLVATTPLIVLVVEAFQRGTPPPVRSIVAAAIVIAGVALILLA